MAPNYDGNFRNYNLIIWQFSDQFLGTILIITNSDYVKLTTYNCNLKELHDRHVCNFHLIKHASYKVFMQVNDLFSNCHDTDS